MSRPLLAGTFSQPPVSIQHMRAGRIMVLGADRQNCWSDQNGRFLLDSMEEVVTLLNAHNYMLVEGTTVVPIIVPEIQPVSESPKKPRKPRTPRARNPANG